MADVVSVTGFILSSMPVGDYDRRVVILSRELGKIAAFAKGARRPNSHLIGVTRPFIFGTFEVYRGRDSYTIQKANVLIKIYLICKLIHIAISNNSYITTLFSLFKKLLMFTFSSSYNWS